MIPSRNSILERLILFFKYFHLFSFACRIRSVGMLVNRETTSKETNSKPSGTVILSTISTYNSTYNGTIHQFQQLTMTTSTDSDSFFTKEDNTIHKIRKKIEYHFGYNIISNFNTLTKMMKKLTVSKSELKFLLKCRSFDIFPRHISNLCKSFKKLSFHSNLINRKVCHLIDYTKKKLLNSEIRDLNIHIKFLTNSINSQIIKLKASTSEITIAEFLKYYDKTLTYFQYKHSHIHTKKFNDLLQFYNINDPQPSPHIDIDTPNNNNSDLNIKKRKKNG